MKIEDQVTCDFKTGELTWLVRNSNRVKIGDIAGDKKPNSCGYKQIQINNKCYKVHRIIWYLKYKIWPNEIDHINGVRDDNRLINLRNVSSQQNSRNVKQSKRNTSGTVGVYWHKRDNLWEAKIKVNNNLINLGSYPTKQEAIAKRKMAEVIYGFHPNHGRN